MRDTLTNRVDLKVYQPIAPVSCSARVTESGAWHSRRCGIKAVVEYTKTAVYSEHVQVVDENPTGLDGVERTEYKDVEKVTVVAFCGIHDPERISARQQKRDEAEASERAREKRIHDSALAIAERIGGRVGYERGRGYTGTIDIGATRAVNIADVLDAARAAVAGTPDDMERLQDALALLDGGK
jgi:hypothetical protein